MPKHKLLTPPPIVQEPEPVRSTRTVFIEGQSHGKRFEMGFTIAKKHTAGFAFKVGDNKIVVTPVSGSLDTMDGTDCTRCILTWGKYRSDADYFERNQDGYVVVHD